jgi:hypothetical protein
MSNYPTYKALVFDVDKSLSTLGGIDKQREIFGVAPVRVAGGLNTINRYIDQLFTANKIPVEHELLGETGEFEYIIDFNEKGKELGLNMVVVDTATMLGQQERRNIIREREMITMDMQGWGIYGERMHQFFAKMKINQNPWVMTAHIKRDSDDNQVTIEIPSLKGSIAMDCAAYFDVIMYTKIEKDAKGRAKKWQWITRADRKHIIAKSRGDVLPPIMDQDLGAVLRAYHDWGETAPKILIIGDSGTGKSWSLGTINSNPEEE